MATSGGKNCSAAEWLAGLAIADRCVCHHRCACSRCIMPQIRLVDLSDLHPLPLTCVLDHVRDCLSLFSSILFNMFQLIIYLIMSMIVSSLMFSLLYWFEIVLCWKPWLWMDNKSSDYNHCHHLFNMGFWDTHTHTHTHTRAYAWISLWRHFKLMQTKAHRLWLWYLYGDADSKLIFQSLWGHKLYYT